jgi:Tol biopolymer transport system component
MVRFYFPKMRAKKEAKAMKIATDGKVSVVLCLSIFLLLCSLNQPVTYAAGYQYGDYYNKNLTNTTTGTTRGPSITGKGDKIVFWSDRNLDDNKNPSNRPQVFLWTSPSTITQITSTNAENYSASSRQPLVSINFDGTYIAFKIYTDYYDEGFFGCTPGNPCATKNIWRYNLNNNSVTTVASTAWNNTSEITALKINNDGQKICFLSNYDFTLGGDTTYELYLWDEGPPSAFTKITSTQSANAPDSAFSVNYDGSFVAFSTKENKPPFDTGNDNNSEIYMCNSNGSGLTQITSTTGGTIGSKEPSITSGSDWTKIAFSSDRDLAGNNADGGTEIFLWTLNGTYSGSNTGSLTQITSASVSGGACRNPQISKDGKFITFVSNVDLISSGGTSLLTPTTSAIFVWNSSGAGTITQVNTKGDYPVIGSYTGFYEGGDIQYGPRIAYYSTADGSEEIFLATSTIPVPATSRWGLMVLIILLATLAVFMLIRKRKTARGEA